MKAMKASPILPRWCLSTDKKQKMSAMVMDTAADLTASKVVENRRSCRPQRVLTNSPTPSTTIATTCAILPKDHTLLQTATKIKVPELVRYSEALSFGSECIINACQREGWGYGWGMGIMGITGTLLFCFIKRKKWFCNLKIKRPLLPCCFLLFVFTPLLGRERQVASGGKARN
jgi:hypothetical protein